MDEPYFNGPLAKLVRKIFSQHTPNPWPDDVERAVHASDAVPLCINCLGPHERDALFCPHCDFPVGDWVPLMPYQQVFWMGEVLRQGVTGPPEKGFWKKFGLVVFSFCKYGPFAPLYWFWMTRKAFGQPICEKKHVEPKFEDA